MTPAEQDCVQTGMRTNRQGEQPRADANERPSVALTTRFLALCEEYGAERLAVHIVAAGGAAPASRGCRRATTGRRGTLTRCARPPLARPPLIPVSCACGICCHRRVHPRRGHLLDAGPLRLPATGASTTVRAAIGADPAQADPPRPTRRRLTSPSFTSLLCASWPTGETLRRRPGLVSGTRTVERCGTGNMMADLERGSLVPMGSAFRGIPRPPRISTAGRARAGAAASATPTSVRTSTGRPDTAPSPFRRARRTPTG